MAVKCSITNFVIPLLTVGEAMLTNRLNKLILRLDENPILPVDLQKGGYPSVGSVLLSSPYWTTQSGLQSLTIGLFGCGQGFLLLLAFKSK